MSIVWIEFSASFVVHEAVECIKFTTIPLSDLFGVLGPDASLLGLSFLLLRNFGGKELLFFLDVAVGDLNALVLDGAVVFHVRLVVVLLF